MAVVSDGFEITLTATDNGGNSGTLTFVCDATEVPDFATAQAVRATLQTAFEAVSQLEVTNMRISEVWYEDAPVYPASNVELENKATISYQILGQRDKGTLNIPAPDPDMFVALAGPSANQVNISWQPLIDYTDLFKSTGPFTISDGERLAFMLKGKRTSTKNRNG